MPATDTVKNRSCTKELKSDISCHTSERSVHCLAIRQQSFKRKAAWQFWTKLVQQLEVRCIARNAGFWRFSILLSVIHPNAVLAQLSDLLRYVNNFYQMTWLSSGCVCLWSWFPVWWTVKLVRSVEICPFLTFCRNDRRLRAILTSPNFTPCWCHHLWLRTRWAVKED